MHAQAAAEGAAPANAQAKGLSPPTLWRAAPVIKRGAHQRGYRQRDKHRRNLSGTKDRGAQRFGEHFVVRRHFRFAV